MPFLTEAYSSSQDPPEKSIPLCTLKSFPNAIEHTLQWARDMFEGLFSNSARTTLNYLKSPDDFFSGLSKLKPHHRLEELEQVERILLAEKCVNFEQCIAWARQNWQENFHDLICQLLFNIPPDQMTSNNQPFWSGLKKCPHALDFSLDEPLHFEYVFAAANLKASLHGLEQCRDKSFIQNILKTCHVEKFEPKQGVKVKLNESDENVDDDELEDQDEARSEKLIDLLKEKYSELKNTQLMPAEFEKDDDENFHMDFITACSNLRALNYDIKPADRHNVMFLTDFNKNVLYT